MAKKIETKQTAIETSYELPKEWEDRHNYSFDELARLIYGSRLIKNLAEKINKKGLNETLLKVSRSFYLEYPQIKDYLSGKSATPSHQFETSAGQILSKLSFSHIREIMTVDDKLSGAFTKIR